MTEATLSHIEIRKDSFRPSQPWCADVYWSDGNVLKSWKYGFRTKTALLEDVRAVSPDATII